MINTGKMGIFKTIAGVGLVKNGAPIFPHTIELLVDTGATYTTIPSKILNSLDIKPVGNISVQYADGRIVEKPYSGAWLNISGRPVSVTVLFGEENDLPVLGATSLEQAGFSVDPVKKILIPVQAIQA